MKRADLEKSIVALPAIELQYPGKIYTKGDTLYIVEKHKGIHVILNADPKNPINQYFIRIPGIVDLAVKGHVLYTDNAVDLISIDISDMNKLTVLDRKRDVFPALTPPGTDWIPWNYTNGSRPSNTIIVGWKRKQM